MNVRNPFDYLRCERCMPRPRFLRDMGKKEKTRNIQVLGEKLRTPRVRGRRSPSAPATTEHGRRLPMNMSAKSPETGPDLPLVIFSETGPGG